MTIDLPAPEPESAPEDHSQDAIRFDLPLPGMATMNLAGREIILRGVTHGELRRFASMSAEIEERYKDHLTAEDETTRERLDFMFKFQADAYGWIADVVHTLGNADLPPQDECPVALTSGRTMAAFLQMWLGA